MNILIFSPSARKVWIEHEKALNPSYWLITNLAVALAQLPNVNLFCVEKSMKSCLGVKAYDYTTKIDMVVSIGASYNPATCEAQFNKGFTRHQRAFDIGSVTSMVFQRWNPVHINLCVDVRKWFPRLTEVFGKEPDYYMTEQEMQWQQVGYYLNDKISEVKPEKTIEFFFSGGLKTRGERFIQLTNCLPITIDGGGWEAFCNNGYTCVSHYYKFNGFQQWKDSVKRMNSAKYGIVLHEDCGNLYNWITAKLFEHLGSKVIAFVDCKYDSDGWYVPKDYPLRVNSSNDILELLKKYSYVELLAIQEILIRPEWNDWQGFFVQPFLKVFQKKFGSYWLNL